MKAVLDLPTMAANLPTPPPESLDPYIDAGARCFARFGVSRTTVPDVARELGVSRTTVYRQVGTISQLAGLFFNRELHRILVVLPEKIAQEEVPEAIVTMVASVVDYARHHPVLEKVLSDEPELVGPFMLRDLPVAVAHVGAVAVPVLRSAMQAGLVRPHDPHVMVEWLARVAVTAVLCPPPVEVRAFLRHLVLPALSPGAPSPRDASAGAEPAVPVRESVDAC